MNVKILSLFKNPRSVLLIFFIAYLAIGVFIYKDYGISWDEPAHLFVIPAKAGI